MAKSLPLIFLLASHLFVSGTIFLPDWCLSFWYLCELIVSFAGVLSTSILTVENKCNHTVWPVIYSYNSQVSTTGFALKRGEARAIHAPSSWFGVISGRTHCSTDSSGNFSCTIGDCKSGKIECTVEYGWSPTTYAFFRIDYEGTNSYTISVEYGYNLPLMVVPSESSPTCISSGCGVDLNKTCPHDLKIFSEGQPIACKSACAKFRTHETCCLRYFKSKQNCKPTLYTNNFESACPLAYVYTYGDSNSTFTCSNSTDYVITFCPCSIPNTTR